MKVLVLGSGAREHALVVALAADPSVTSIVAAPGNPGMGVPCLPVDAADPVAVAALAAGYDLVVVGPELPLAFGLVDEFLRGQGVVK